MSNVQRKRRKRGFLYRRKKDFEYLVFLVFYKAAGFLPRSLGLALFAMLGDGFAGVMRREYRRTCSNLTSVFGAEWTKPQVQDTARAVFRSAARNLFDAVKFSRNPGYWCPRLVTHDNLDTFERDCKKGKGVLVATAHLGCFELLFPYVAYKGYPAMAVGQHLFDPRVDEIVRKARSGSNMEFFSRSDSALSVVRRLRTGRVLGVLIDQDTNVEGVFARFLGRLAYTPSGLFRFALRFAIPIHIMVTARQPDGHHHIFTAGPLEIERSADLTADTVRLLETINQWISDLIRRYPDQWVWMHRRWRKTPGDPRWSSVPSIEQYEQKS